MEACIIVPSHITNITRTKMLMRCLHSLTEQTTKIPIYLSISFETELDRTLFDKLLEKNDLINNEALYIIYQLHQTSQFRHIEGVIDNIKNTYKYVMFCDDDDTYEINRVKSFMYAIKYGIATNKKDTIFVGALEIDIQKGTHSHRFYEYWSYCVNIEFIVNFMNILKINNYDYVIDNKMCDVLFASYLRHLDGRHLFVSICDALYNYNKNEYGITGTISRNNKRKRDEHVQTYSKNFEEHIKGLNKHIELHMQGWKNNIFVSCAMCRDSFDDILKRELKEDYMYKDKIDKILLSKIKDEYDMMKSLCDILYQYKQ
jgi:hypothetical protein